jgi:hypothetical protein
MTAQAQPRGKLSLSSWILIGMTAGILCGIFFREYCAFLQFFGPQGDFHHHQCPYWVTNIILKLTPLGVLPLQPPLL